MSPQNDQGRIEPVFGAVSRQKISVYIRNNTFRAGAAVGVVIIEKTAVQRKQPLCKLTSGEGAAFSGGVHDVSGAGTVSIPDPDPFSCDPRDGLIPRNTHKFAGSSFSDAFHRILETPVTEICRMIVDSPGACCEHNVTVGFFFCLSCNLDHFAVFDMAFNKT